MKGVTRSRVPKQRHHLLVAALVFVVRARVLCEQKLIAVEPRRDTLVADAAPAKPIRRAGVDVGNAAVDARSPPFGAPERDRGRIAPQAVGCVEHGLLTFPKGTAEPMPPRQERCKHRRRARLKGGAPRRTLKADQRFQVLRVANDRLVALGNEPASDQRVVGQQCLHERLGVTKRQQCRELPGRNEGHRTAASPQPAAAALRRA